MSRRMCALVLMVVVAAGAVASPAAGKKKPRRVERTVEVPYSMPAPAFTVQGDIYGACRKDGTGCVEIVPQPGELFARVEVIDATGLAVHALVEGPGGNVDVCGKTPEPIFLGSDSPFLVWIFEGPCGDGTPAAATSGDVVVTLSNQP